MLIPRQIEYSANHAATQFPVVTILGPRQSGKTTLAKKIFPNYKYVNLEAPDSLEQIKSDPRGFLNRYKEGVIFDEIQKYPDLLSYIQVIADETNAPGQYILTGSQQLALSNSISQSLAGRTALLTLLPLSITELAYVGIEQSIDKYIFAGFYPRIYQNNLDPIQVSRSYVHTYLERDVHQLINIKDINLFEKFIRLCAGRVGQVLNKNTFANEIGVSSHTIQSWLSILEASYVIRLLQPYYANLGKRLIKSPKLYFTDIGLVSYLLGITQLQQIETHHLRGQLFENMIVMELYKSKYNRDDSPNLYFYRDGAQNEVDIIHVNGDSLIPIEIKSSSTFNKQFLKGLNYFNNKVINKPNNISYLVYGGHENYPINNINILGYLDSDECFN